MICFVYFFFFFQAEDGIRDVAVTGVQTCALPISGPAGWRALARPPRGTLATAGRPPAPGSRETGRAWDARARGRAGGGPRRATAAEGGPAADAPRTAPPRRARGRTPPRRAGSQRAVRPTSAVARGP